MSQPDNVLAMRQLLSGIINSPTQQHLKKAIDWVNNNLISVEKMDCFLELKDFYHYFYIISESAITEPNLNTIVSELITFYEKIISVCFQINCISRHFEDNRLFNLIQFTLKRLITEREPNPIGSQPSDSEVLNKCIPLMFSSMIIIVSTFHGFKKVVEISKPITDYVMKFKSECVSDHWKQLIQQLLIVSKIAKRINNTNQTDVESLTPFTLTYLDTFLGNNPFNSHMTHKAIRYFCIERQISLDQLFIELQSDISGHVLRLIDINSNFENLKELLQKAMSFFGINTVPYELMRHIVPHFVISCDSKTELFIKEMSRIDGRNVSEVILTYLSDIIRQLFYSKTFTKTLPNIEKVMTTISIATNFDIEYRIKFLSSDLISNYLLFISIDYNSTLEVIAYIQYLKNEKDSKYELNYFFNKESELRNTLRELFLNFVHKFEFKIQDNSICHKEKMVFLESFLLLLEFMDKNCINTYRVKLFSTIKLIVSDRFCHNIGFIKMSIEGMKAFIKKVDESYLSSQLLTISALTLRLIQYNNEEPLVIFKELIIKQKSNPLFQSTFKNLYFIPELNQLEEVTQVLRPYITYDETNEEEICEKITLVVNNLNHENSSVQFYSLLELSKLLRKHQNLIYEKCDNYKELDFDYFVNHIISQLMVCLKSTDNNVLSSAAECIGILGAVDPLRVDLEKPIISREGKSEKFLNFNDKDFKILLITRLYRAITTATQTVDQYCASYALQEVVKMFTEDKETGIRLSELSEELRHFCSIILNTKYSQKSILTVSDSQIEKSKPIFGSTPNMTYAEWLTDWITFLFESFILKNENKEENEYKAITSLLSQSSGNPSDFFDNDLAKNLNYYAIKTKVLRFCSQIILRNQSIAKFLLPYIVISSLKYATPPQRQVIVNEIQQIITTLTTDKYIFDDELGHLSSQTVFHIFDHLKVWHKYRVKLHNRICATEGQKKTARVKDREFKGVQFFLDGISHKELAKLAFKCNAFSRSLRYLEEYIKSNEEKKENKIQNLFQNEIPFFQNVFIRLEDPDSVEGCNSKRNPNNPTLNEMILTHEAMGQFQEALICCEKAISLDPNDFECQRKYLQISMDSFDQSAMVRTYGMGLILSRPEWRPKLAPFIIEAVWRLGDWNQLSTLLEQNDINLNNNFGAGIGDLFHKMISKNHLNEFDQKVLSLRQTLIGPLSAAATEISGYVRGHKYIVDLHILHDINHIFNEIIIDLSEDVVSIENMKTKFFKVIDIWDDRTHLVRNTTKNREPILNAQRALLGVLSHRCSDLSPLIKKELFNLWLKSTKTARKSGNIQRSYNCLLEMNKIRESLLKDFFGDCPLTDIENCEAILETAKIQWNKNNSIGFQSLYYF